MQQDQLPLQGGVYVMASTWQDGRPRSIALQVPEDGGWRTTAVVVLSAQPHPGELQAIGQVVVAAVMA